MSKMKYIVVGEQHAVIFPDFIGHDRIASAFRDLGRGAITSAGFVSIGPCPVSPIQAPLEVKCSGGSSSLGIESKPEEDAKLILKQIQGWS